MMIMQPPSVVGPQQPLFWQQLPTQFNHNMVSVRSEKPICAPPRLPHAFVGPYVRGWSIVSPVRFSSVQIKMVSVRSEKPICAPPRLPHAFVGPYVRGWSIVSPVQFSSDQDGICALGKAHMRFTPSLGSFHNVAFETVPMLSD